MNNEERAELPPEQIHLGRSSVVWNGVQSVLSACGEKASPGQHCHTTATNYKCKPFVFGKKNCKAFSRQPYLLPWHLFFEPMMPPSISHPYLLFVVGEEPLKVQWITASGLLNHTEMFVCVYYGREGLTPPPQAVRRILLWFDGRSGGPHDPFFAFIGSHMNLLDSKGPEFLLVMQMFSVKPYVNVKMLAG